MTVVVVPLHTHTSQPLAEEIGCLDFHRRGGEKKKDASARGFLLIACTFPSSSSSIKARPPSPFQVCCSPHSPLLYVAPACLPSDSISHCFSFVVSPHRTTQTQFQLNRCEAAGEKMPAHSLVYCISVRLSLSTSCEVHIYSACSYPM